MQSKPTRTSLVPTPFEVLALIAIITVSALVTLGIRSGDTARNAVQTAEKVAQAQMAAILQDGSFTESVERLQELRPDLRSSLDGTGTHLKIDVAGPDGLAFKVTTGKFFAFSRTIDVVVLPEGKSGQVRCSFSGNCPSWEDLQSR